ncbi:hypothetical protein GR11A_00169 [Vibrio phage vB_VcorM_GR11A]|nr:hypothetical protein GR11A_00169 [Vibrio phage vB_VcorM_GR11A]
MGKTKTTRKWIPRPLRQLWGWFREDRVDFERHITMSIENGMEPHLLIHDYASMIRNEHNPPCSLLRRLMRRSLERALVNGLITNFKVEELRERNIREQLERQNRLKNADRSHLRRVK